MASPILINLLVAYYFVTSTSQADLNTNSLRSFNAESNITDGEVDEVGTVFLSAGSHL